jgi:hypothetical protein
MKKSFLSVSILCTILLAGCQTPSSNQNTAPEQTPPAAPPPVSAETLQKKNAKLYFVALNGTDAAAAATEKIGCDDTLVGVRTDVSDINAATPAEAALQKLLSVKDDQYEKSGLYNALYQSDLKVDGITVDDSKKATVKLSGTTQLGGVCDIPRFEEQLKATVLQFSDTYKEVEFLINGKKMESVLSLKGE